MCYYCCCNILPVIVGKEHEIEPWRLRERASERVCVHVCAHEKERDRTGLVCSASYLTALQSQCVYFVDVRSTLSLCVLCGCSCICCPHLLFLFKGNQQASTKFESNFLCHKTVIVLSYNVTFTPTFCFFSSFHLFFCQYCGSWMYPHVWITSPCFSIADKAFCAARVIPDLICFMSLLYSKWPSLRYAVKHIALSFLPFPYIPPQLSLSLSLLV